MQITVNLYVHCTHIIIKENITEKRLKHSAPYLYFFSHIIFYTRVPTTYLYMYATLYIVTLYPDKCSSQFPPFTKSRFFIAHY